MPIRLGHGLSSSAGVEDFDPPDDMDLPTYCAPVEASFEGLNACPVHADGLGYFGAAGDEGTPPPAEPVDVGRMSTGAMIAIGVAILGAAWLAGR